MTTTTVRSRLTVSDVTVREAALLTGKSRETINSATKDGTLSFSLNGRNHKVIAIAELERIYPLKKNMEQIKVELNPVSHSSPGMSDSDIKTELVVLKQKLAHNEVMQETFREERGRERRQLESEIETLRASLEKSQEQHSKFLLLITDQSQSTKERAGDWEITAQKLKDQIANQESSLEKRIHEIRQETQREALQEIKSKYWWQVAFGS